MDELQRMQLRMACLEMAKQVAIATQNVDGIESLAETYWKWVTKEDPSPTQQAAPPSTDDDIPF